MSIKENREKDALTPSLKREHRYHADSSSMIASGILL
jgi:hypothetical protein